VHHLLDVTVTARYAVAARLTAGAAVAPAVNPAVVVDLMWARATPADRLDHVRVRGLGTADELDVVLILRATSALEAGTTITALCARAADSPALTGWTLERIDTLQLTDLDIRRI
jgi:hypothetical protein